MERITPRNSRYRSFRLPAILAACAVLLLSSATATAKDSASNAAMGKPAPINLARSDTRLRQEAPIVAVPRTQSEKPATATPSADDALVLPKPGITAAIFAVLLVMALIGERRADQATRIASGSR